MKKTHLGPKRRQTRCLGPFSSVWAFVGLRWPSLATQWLLWAFVGLRWPSLAVVGYCGFSWTCVGLHWLLVNKNKMKILYIKKITHLVWALFFPCCPSKPPSMI